MADKQEPTEQTAPVEKSQNPPIANSAKEVVSDAPAKEQFETSAWERFKFIRDEIRFQHTLLGSRISWLLAAEAFFFTSYGSSRGSANADVMHYFWRYTIPLCALLIAALTFMVVLAALERIRLQRDLLTEYCTVRVLPIGSTKDVFYHRITLWYAKLVPWVFIIAWLVILVYSVFDIEQKVTSTEARPQNQVTNAPSAPLTVPEQQDSKPRETQPNPAVISATIEPASLPEKQDEKTKQTQPSPPVNEEGKNP